MTGTLPSVGEGLLDRYTIERELGRGGMAVVHLAEEKKHTRKVAIKILRRDFTASVGAERFLREIGIAARLSHPHIVPLIDSGETDGQLYYVSPFIPGGSLRDRLRVEKRLPLPDVQRIARDMFAIQLSNTARDCSTGGSGAMSVAPSSCSLLLRQCL